MNESPKLPPIPYGRPTTFEARLAFVPNYGAVAVLMTPAGHKIKVSYNWFRHHVTRGDQHIVWYRVNTTAGIRKTSDISGEIHGVLEYDSSQPDQHTITPIPDAWIEEVAS